MNADGPKIAESVVITEDGIFVNGEPFPWVVALDPAVKVEAEYNTPLARVTLTFYAEHVEVHPWPPNE